jgi:hypothetical protein
MAMTPEERRSALAILRAFIPMRARRDYTVEVSTHDVVACRSRDTDEGWQTDYYTVTPNGNGTYRVDADSRARDCDGLFETSEAYRATVKFHRNPKRTGRALLPTVEIKSIDKRQRDHSAEAMGY